MDRDLITFAAQRRNDRLAVVCTGTDTAGNPVEFELAPALLRSNLRRQFEWSVKAEMAGQVYDALMAAGMDADSAWIIVASLSPAPIEMPTGTASTAQASNGDHHALQRVDHVGRQSRDGD